jgi:hypothetical protein
MLLGEWPEAPYPQKESVTSDAMLLGEWPEAPYPQKESVTSLKANPQQHRSENLIYYIIKILSC